MRTVWGWLGVSREEVQSRNKIADNCIVEGCNQPFHKGYCLCIDHHREFRTSDVTGDKDE